MDSIDQQDQAQDHHHDQKQPLTTNSIISSSAMRHRSNSDATDFDAPTPCPSSNDADQDDHQWLDSTASTPVDDLAQDPMDSARRRNRWHHQQQQQQQDSIDAEDEDVKIAIMALGAMKHLDGSSSNSSNASSSSRFKSSSNASEDAQMEDRSHADVASLTGSAVSSSSAVSSASSVSTPATEFTQLTSPPASTSGLSAGGAQNRKSQSFSRAQNYAQLHSNRPKRNLSSGGSGGGGGSGGLATDFSSASTSTSTSTSADESDFVAGSSTNSADLDQSTSILKELPEGFQLPSTIYDENGNEIKIDQQMMEDEDFLRRISHLPIVRSTLRAYEMGKQSSRVVKYGANFVESSVKSISRPVVSRLGASLGNKGVEQLDEFACRQLDRIYPSPSDRAISKDEKASIIEELDERSRTDWKDMSSDEISKRRNAYWSLRLEEKEREMVVNELRQRKGKGKERARADTEMSESSQDSGGWVQETTANDGAVFVGPGGKGKAGSGQVVRAADGLRAARTNISMPGPAANGSRWGSMLVEAGMTAGGLTAAMSEESMKSLKYCLQWLQYATAHIEYQITVLRDLMVKLNHGELEMSAQATQNLDAIKGDVLNTIKGVVDVVGKYAGAALPEQAKASVKAFILSLPARWATVNQTPTSGPAAGVGARAANFGGSPVSPSFSPAHLSSGVGSSAGSSSPSSITHGSGAQQQRRAAAITAQGANRVLTLAVESLDILRSVTVVFGESLDRADLWVERLRVLGLQRKRQHEQAALQAAGFDDEHLTEDEYGNRLGSASPQPWENSYDARTERGISPGADSNVSEGTSKRRRVKSSRKSSNASLSQGSTTPNLTFSPSSTRRSSSSNIDNQNQQEEILFHQGSSHVGNESAFSSSRSSHNHPHAGHTQATRRNRPQHRQTGSRPSSAAHTPNFSYTPLPSEMRRNLSSSSKGSR